jgi:ribosomal protein S18 acetylase RimI-like enzyme
MIRKATLEDARAIADIHVKSWQSAYRELLPADFLASLSVDRREEQWTQLLPNAEQTILVYDLEPIVAFCSFAPTRDSDMDSTTVAELGTIYALESCWGQGVGKKLWGEAVKQMRGRGFSEMTLWVLKGNGRAVHFYERMGMTFDGRAKTETWQNGVVLNELRYHTTL